MPIDEQVKECIKSAFSPLRCGVDVWDYSYRVKFKVLDAEGNCILDEPDLPIWGVGENRLRMKLSWYRDMVQEKGFVLDDWQEHNPGASF